MTATHCRACNRTSRSQRAVAGEGSTENCYRCGSTLEAWKPGNAIELNAHLRSQGASDLKTCLVEIDRLGAYLMEIDRPGLVNFARMFVPRDDFTSSPSERQFATHMAGVIMALPAHERAAWLILDSIGKLSGRVYDSRILARGVTGALEERAQKFLFNLFRSSYNEFLILCEEVHWKLLQAANEFGGTPNARGITQWDSEFVFREVIRDRLHPDELQAWARGKANENTDEEVCRTAARAWAAKHGTTLERIIISASVGRPAVNSDAALRPPLYHYLHERGDPDALIGTVLEVSRQKVYVARTRFAKKVADRGYVRLVGGDGAPLSPGPPIV